MRRLQFGLLILGLLICAPAFAGNLQPAKPTQDDARSRQVLLVSIDGLLPDYYLRARELGIDLPTLARLRSAGSSAERVTTVCPSLTYPAHTTMATGCYPARHGIVSNTRLDAGLNPVWFFESASIRVPALWDVLKQHGLRCGGVSWPVSVGARMDVIYPESHQDPPGTTWFDLARSLSTPGLLDDVVTEMGGFGSTENRNPSRRDDFAIQVARHMLMHERPDLLMLHLVEVDYAQHATGPYSPESLAAMVRTDQRLGSLISLLRWDGDSLADTVIVAGDHGSSPIHTAIQPNVLLRESGLLSTGPGGEIKQWSAICHRGAIYLGKGTEGALGDRVVRIFQELSEGRYRGLFRVVLRDELKASGADTGPLMLIEAAEGYAVSDALLTTEFLVATGRRGAHGYLPDHPGMDTGLIMSGSGIRPGIVVPRARLVDIAPTVARLLGCEMPASDGVPIVGVLSGE
jgi:predicted AlkP superfamily pyrophosphatase or phosphodiesterase